MKRLTGKPIGIFLIVFGILLTVVVPWTTTAIIVQAAPIDPNKAIEFDDIDKLAGKDTSAFEQQMKLKDFNYNGGVIGDDYPYGALARASQIDPWRFFVCECTSFCAYRLNAINGFNFNNYWGGPNNPTGGPQWGHAYNWDNVARQLGYAVNNSPAIGAIAYWEPGRGYGNGYYASDYGHVAWVAEVNGGSITVEEYNGKPIPHDGEYSYRSCDVGAPSGYIHLQDITISAPTPTPQPVVTGTPMKVGYEAAVPDGIYEIVSVLDNDYILDIEGGTSFSDSPNAQIWYDRGAAMDTYELTYNKNTKFYRIKHVQSGKYLDVSGGSKNDEANVQAYNHNHDDSYAQQWAIRATGNNNNTYIIETRCSGFGLDVHNAIVNSGTNVKVKKGNSGGAAGQWRLIPCPSNKRPVTDGNYHIVSKMYGETYGLNVAGTSGNFRNVTAAQNLTSASQVFSVAFESGTNSYTIKQKNTKYYLEVENCANTRNIGVATGTADGKRDGNWKSWVFPSAGSGWYGIVSKFTGEGAYYNSRNGSNVTVTPGNMLYEDQYWKFVRAVDGVSISKASASGKAGESISLSATVNPSAAANKSVTWSSSDKNVATVDGAGKVSLKAVGTAVITVKTTDGGYTASCNVTVSSGNVAVTGVTLNQTSISLEKDEGYTLTVSVKPDNATNKTVSWSSSDPDIATVDSNGKVTAINVGTATITVKTNDGGKTAACTVTVEESGTEENGAPDLSGNIFDLEGTVGSPFKYRFVAISSTPVTYSIDGGLPSGITFDGDCRISGTPEKAGFYYFDLYAMNDSGEAMHSFQVNIKESGQEPDPDPDPDPEPEPDPDSSITVSPASISLEVGGKYTLTAITDPEGIDVTWSSSDEAIAKVNKKGVVTGVSEGSAVITATSGSTSASAMVYVNGPSVDYDRVIRLNKRALLKAKKKIAYIMNTDTSLVKVKIKGKKLYVTGKNPGVTTITAYSRTGVAINSWTIKIE